jgi:hypothetical protein
MSTPLSADPSVVPVPRAAFVFCRYAVAAMVWAGLLLRAKWLIVATLVVLALSAALGVARAPLVWIYRMTVERLFPSAPEDLNPRAMRFAHAFGSLFAAVCVVVLYAISEPWGWRLVFLFAILKTISAVGVCPATKLYGCMTSGTCCAILRKRT